MVRKPNENWDSAGGFHEEVGARLVPGRVPRPRLDRGPKGQAGLGEGTQSPYDPGHIA